MRTDWRRRLFLPLNKQLVLVMVALNMLVWGGSESLPWPVLKFVDDAFLSFASRCAHVVL